ncbi:MAG: polysaccharide biosynthesis protein [Gemmatimonadaceae bacterium]|nr:polysaccharide biosynthesis protein [Gemmatimonadaceae bacterium]
MLMDGAIVLITGGTGSFGNAVVRRLLSMDVREIRIFSRDETKQEDMRVTFRSSKLKFHIGDVRDYKGINEALKGVDFVFHAAALKQVPSCEFYPMEAVRTNALGAENVMDAAIANRVRTVVMLSTDKAVYPINAMGLSKALMEKLMLAKARTHQAGDTILCCTRYGNVMASRGSVIPLFVQQVRENKPLTITDGNMTRFLMSLDDSVGLVQHAFQFSRPGDIFVQRAPAVTILDLANAVKEVFQKDNPLETIGTRHGEKLYETLVSREEMARVEDRGLYFRIPSDNRDLNYDTFVIQGKTSISDLDDYTSHNAERLSVPRVVDLLRGLEFIQNQLSA